MDRFSISQLSSKHWSLYQDVIRYNSLGFSSIGIWREKIRDCDLFEAIDFLHEMRTSVSSVHWAGGFTGGSYVRTTDVVDDAIEAIELTSRLEGGCLILHPGCRNGHTINNATRLLMNALRELVPVAADYGVRLGLEFMPCPAGQQWTFLSCVNQMLELVEEFPSDQLGFVLDLYHVGLNSEVFENLDQFADRICLVQLADRSYRLNEQLDVHRKLLGEGDVPLEKWFERLFHIGYRGKYEVEIHGESVAHLKYEHRLIQTEKYLRNVAIPVPNNFPEPSPSQVPLRLRRHRKP